MMLTPKPAAVRERGSANGQILSRSSHKDSCETFHFTVARVVRWFSTRRQIDTQYLKHAY
jgi:hypothetical protein